MDQSPAGPKSTDAASGAKAGSAGEFLRQALAAYEARRYGRAETILRQIVEQRPDDGRAWHLRGLNALAAKKPERAAAFLIRAVTSDSGNAPYYAALAATLTQLGRDADALASWRRAADLDPGGAACQTGLAHCLSRQERYREALPAFEAAVDLSPDDAPLRAAFGYALQRQGLVDQAVNQYRQALFRDPLLHNARLNLAAALRDFGEHEEAAEHCREVLRHNPRSASALTNLGAALCSLGRNDEAVRHLQAALRIEPENLITLHNLGVALDAAGASRDAESCLRKALQIRPEFTDAQSSLANLLRGAGRLEEAAALYRAVIDRKPLDFRSYGNLGLVLLNLNKPQDAIAIYEKALALQPDQPGIRMSLGIAQLLVGDFASGWANYEARWAQEGAKRWRPEHPAPLWTGEPLDSLATGSEPPTILVHAEQGFGDSIHFCRYLPKLAAEGAKIVFECQPSLVKLMETLAAPKKAYALRIVSRDDPASSADRHVPLLSLPRLFDTRLETIPVEVPYLSAPPASVAAWADYPFAEQPTVGLVWSGNPQRQDDSMRSCPVGSLEPLRDLDYVRFYSLAKDAPEMPALPLDDLGPRLADFADTAAAIERLDLVISVDTATAHLAGALGRPVWVMLGYAADWRYLLDREDSPWYPTMRLFRQASPGDWLSVTRCVADALRRHFPRKQ
jgi:tetratricopeptide (TPR) repeat protein